MRYPRAVPPPLTDAELQTLRQILVELRQGSGQELPRATLARLAALGHGGARLTIDMTAAAQLGAPVVVVQPPPAPDPCFATLTPRQREVAGLVATGLRNKDIALALGIGLGTVKDHVHAILERTGLDSRAAVAAAWQGGAPGGSPR